MSYCAEAKNKRFGVIEFAIGAKMSDPFKYEIRMEEPDWHRIYRKVDDELVDTGKSMPRSVTCPASLPRRRMVRHIGTLLFESLSPSRISLRWISNRVFLFRLWTLVVPNTK